MDPSFGVRLRLQRERQGVALTAIAEQTKIKLSLLEGLERDDVSHWPAGIFSRSHVRAYAQAIGLDAETTVREFLEIYPDSVEEIPAEARSAAGESISRRPPTRLQFLIGSAIDALPVLRLQPGQRSGLATQKTPAADRDYPVAGNPLRAERDLSAAAPPTVAVAVGDLSVERHPEQVGLDLTAVAHLCTTLGRALAVHEVAPVLEDAARILDAVGLMLWMWDPRESALSPVFAHGYSHEMIAQLRRVPGDSDIAIAAAFRSAETLVVDGSDLTTGAVVAPLVTPTGCAGVLALELRHGGEQRECVQASATILAAQLSAFVAYPALAHAVSA